MSSDRPNYHHMLIPINFLQWNYISVRSRVLLAMGLHMDNTSRVSTLSAGELAILLGFVNEDGLETEEGIKAVRQARQALTKAGALRYIYHRKSGNNFHSWEIMCSPLRPGLEGVWPKKNIVDLWAEAEASESKVAKPKVAKSEEVVEEEEVVEGPSAADLALRQAVLARARAEAAEAEEAERREAEEAPPEPSEAPAGKRKSAFTWDMIGL
jgi:hypothetical protein